jgi:hypothetical protein
MKGLWITCDECGVELDISMTGTPLDFVPIECPKCSARLVITDPLLALEADAFEAAR